MSFDLFKRRFSSKRSVGLRVKDLRCLIDIAAHPHLGQSIKELQIRATVNTTVDIFTESMERIKRRRIMPRDIPDEDQDEEGYTRIFRRWEQFLPRLLGPEKEEEHLRKSGLTSSYLVHAMQMLNNLEVVTHVVEELTAKDMELKTLWLDERSPRTSSEYELKPEPEYFSQEDCRALYDFDYCFQGWCLHPGGGSIECFGDTDTIISAMIASRTPVAKLAICDGLFFKDGDAQEEYTPGSHGLRALLLREGLRGLTSVEISLRLYTDPDVNYPHWFLSAVPDTFEALKIECKSGRHLLDDPLETRNENSDYEIEDYIDLYDQILLWLKFPSLRRLDLAIPPAAGSAMNLSHFIRTNNKKLRHIRLSCEDFDLEPNTARWSEVLLACLEAQNLNYLELWYGSDDYDIEGISQPEKGCILEDGLGSSPNNPGRERLEKTLRSWQRLEAAAGL